MDSPGITTQRHRTRIEVNRLIYVQLPGEHAFMLNVSDGGMAIQAMNILEPESMLRFSVLVPESAEQIEASGRVVWSDKSGRAGVQFTQSIDIRRLPISGN